MKDTDKERYEDLLVELIYKQSYFLSKDEILENIENGQIIKKKQIFYLLDEIQKMGGGEECEQFVQELVGGSTVSRKLIDFILRKNKLKPDLSPQQEKRVAYIINDIRNNFLESGSVGYLLQFVRMGDPAVQSLEGQVGRKELKPGEVDQFVD